MITTALGATNRFLSICDPSKKGIKSDPNVMNRYISRVCRWSSVFHVNVIFPQPSFYSEIRDLFERLYFQNYNKNHLSKNSKAYNSEWTWFSSLRNYIIFILFYKVYVWGELFLWRANMREVPSFNIMTSNWELTGIN